MWEDICICIRGGGGVRQKSSLVSFDEGWQGYMHFGMSVLFDRMHIASVLSVEIAVRAGGGNKVGNGRDRPAFG